MRDPDFTFILDHENQELIIQEYQLDGSVYGTMYERTCDEDGNYDKNLLAALKDKFIDNINALEELKRLEDAAANGNALYKIEDKEDVNYGSDDIRKRKQ